MPAYKLEEEGCQRLDPGSIDFIMAIYDNKVVDVQWDTNRTEQTRIYYHFHTELQKWRWLCYDYSFVCHDLPHSRWHDVAENDNGIWMLVN